MILNLIIATFLLFSLITIKVAYDYRQWLKNRNKVLKKSMIAHAKEFVLMALCSSPSIYLFTKQSAFVWWFAALLSACMCAWIIWNLFDGVFNIIRGFGWFFTGSGEDSAANTDKLLKHFKPWEIWAVKLIPLAFFIYHYFNNLK
jgi:hypothetical protein